MNMSHEGSQCDSQDQQSPQNTGLEVRKTANEAIISKLYVYGAFFLTYRPC